MKKQFNAEKAVKMYQKGAAVVDIAVAMGYEKGTGQNRVRNALIKAGVYNKAAGRKAATSKTETATSNNNGQKVVAMPVPSGPDMAARECYKFVQDRYTKLIGRQRTGFIEKVVGLLLAGTGVHTAQKIAPVELPQDLPQLRKASA